MAQTPFVSLEKSIGIDRMTVLKRIPVKGLMWSQLPEGAIPSRAPLSDRVRYPVTSGECGRLVNANHAARKAPTCRNE